LRRTKLETCLSILEALANQGPLKKTQIMQKANVNCNVWKNYCDFLIKQDAVEERHIGHDRTVYAITGRGLYLIGCFIELNQVIPTAKYGTKKIEHPE
jgi:predicted transcriptional regulator